MKTIMRLCLAVSVTLTGCAVSDNPREGGLFGGVVGLSNGTYEKRLEEREQNLDTLRAVQADLGVDQAALETEKRGLAAQVTRERTQLAALDDNIGALERRVVALRGTEASAGQRVASLQQQLATLKGKVNQQTAAIDALEGADVADPATEARRRQLEAQRASLQQEYQALLDYTLQLAQ